MTGIGLVVNGAGPKVLVFVRHFAQQCESICEVCAVNYLAIRMQK